MTIPERLTPPQLRDLADLCSVGNRVVTLTANGETTRFYPNKDLAYVLREEAARREAEAKSDYSIEACAARNVEHGGCEGCPTPTGCACESHCDRHNRPWPKTWSERYKDRESFRADDRTDAGPVRDKTSTGGPASGSDKPAPQGERREADAKPVKISQPECHEPGGCIAPVACVQFGKCPQKPEAAPQGEREGPGSAAAPTVEGLVCHAEVTADGELRIMHEEPAYEPPTFMHRETWEIVALAMNQTADLLLNQNDPRYALLHEFANKLGERSEELKEYAKTLSPRASVEDKPTPAAGELVTALDEIAATYGHSRIGRSAKAALSRIEAQARDLAGTQAIYRERDRAANEALFKLEAAEARVRELEADNAAVVTFSKHSRERAYAESARVRELEKKVDEVRQVRDRNIERAESAIRDWHAEKARADKLAADNTRLREALTICRELADHIARAPLPVFRQHAARVRDCIDNALASEGGKPNG